MGAQDLDTPIRFLQTAYEPDDWIAVLLKTYLTGEATQRVVSVATATSRRFQAWLRYRNAQTGNVYVSVNAVEPHGRSRTRSAIRAVRHRFLDVDRDSARVLDAITRRDDLPIPSYILRSSPDRDDAERVQRHLARQLSADLAATSCAQTTRLPGFRNHKYRPAALVTVTYGDVRRTYHPADFPRPPVTSPERPTSFAHRHVRHSRFERAARDLAARPPAITGQHGDLHTFRPAVASFAASRWTTATRCASWPPGTPVANRRGRSKSSSKSAVARAGMAASLSEGSSRDALDTPLRMHVF